MKKIKVLGVTNSIALNKANGYFAVGYYDESLVSIHDYKTGEVIHKINTSYCSAYNSVLAVNEKYLVILDEAKKIKIYDAKNFDLIKTLSSEFLQGCGSVNTILLDDETLYITTNRLIGRNDDYREVFVCDIGNGNMHQIKTDFYLKKSFLFDNKLFMVGNGQYGTELLALEYQESYHNLNKDWHVKRLGYITNQLLEKIVIYEHGNNSNEVKLFLNTGENHIGHKNINVKIYKNYEFDISPDVLDITVGGYYNDNKSKMITVLYKEFEKKYKYCGHGIDEPVIYLDCDVITQSSASDDTYYCFGVDKSIIFVELDNG